MSNFGRSRMAGVFGLLAALLLSGCGGGGGTPIGDVAGVVTDSNGRAVADALVAVGSNSTTSLSNGTFTLHGIQQGFQTFVAAIPINGHRWSGQTVVDVAGDTKNRSVNIVVSDEQFQGSIAGSVIDPSGNLLSGAKVFVQQPIASTLAVTDDSGNYRASRLAPGTYTVTCSLAGFINQTTSVQVVANQTSAASFALTFSSNSGTLAAPQNVSAQAITTAASISRAESSTKNLYAWIRRLYRKKKGLSNVSPAVHVEYRSPKRSTPSKSVVRPSRSTPAGSVIEVDLFWDYQAFDNLFGYAISRGTDPNSLAVTAVDRDPLSNAFFDLDPILTPDTIYYYAVSRLDTILFPQDGTIGPLSTVVSAQPLDPINTAAPGQGATVSGNPVLSWTAVNGAATYQIVVWDVFPDLQDPNDPNGVTPIWPADFQNPGSSLVNAPNTSQTYGGPPLQSGHTYYWLVVAADSSGNDLSITPLAKFIEQ